MNSCSASNVEQKEYMIFYRWEQLVNVHSNTVATRPF